MSSYGSTGPGAQKGARGLETPTLLMEMLTDIARDLSDGNSNHLHA